MVSDGVMIPPRTDRCSLARTFLHCDGSVLYPPWLAAGTPPRPGRALHVSIRLRLIVMNFLQFFIWGSWLLTIGAYWFQNKQWSGTGFGAIFSTMGIAALFMPSLVGIVADKWINAEKLYGLLQIAGAVVLFMIPSVNDPGTLFWVMLLNMICYMPTIALAIAVAYNALKGEGLDVVRDYPPIR